MVKQMSGVDWVATVLVIVGAVNWGLAIWGVNLVEFLSVSWLIKLVYALVGLSGLWLIYKLFAE